MPRFTLSKDERLSSLKEIDQLFAEGKSIASQPIRLIWRQRDSVLPGSPKICVMFAVMKKKFPHAVDRNRIKRLMRENYRLIKPELLSTLTSSANYNVAFLFIGNQLPEYTAIQKAMANAFDRWLNIIHATPPSSETN
jgi:ribonuclease P protein component